MRNGKETETGKKMPILNSFRHFSCSKFEEINNTIPDSIAGHSIFVTKKENKIQLGGMFPRYFWKGLLVLINQGVFNAK